MVLDAAKALALLVEIRLYLARAPVIWSDINKVGRAYHVYDQTINLLN